MNNNFFFGIDGGGTRSRIAIVNQAGEILARSEAESTNIYSVTKEQVLNNLSVLLDRALPQCGLERSDLAAGCIGSAGLGRPGEIAVYRGFVDTLLGAGFPIKLCTDGEILLVGGLGSLEGYCLIAGTGSVALGRSAGGDLVRAGGHGYLLGDEGSAAWIGRSAIARCLRSLEGRDLHTVMLPALLEAANLTGSDELVRYVHHEASKALIAALAPAVTAAARKGDPLALDILQTGAVELALLVRSVVERSREIQRQVLVLAGGVIEHDEILTDALLRLIKKEVPAITIEEKRGSALDGACLLARKLV